MAQAIQDARYAVVTHQTTTIYRLFDGGPLVLVPFLIVAVVLVIGVVYFRARSRYFAEDI